ncbi:transketolase family protein [Chitinivibrio alkaliphilus]|uniref:transketolase n=1 Tax=Chitinivibrio alkaliphilus ACht1 TaxID=1313304 RepID=U7D6Y7_9BACT|nr:transketolase [Chitinivibrio alkaliphilus]ERP31708.1 transketolase [Chitinivibrio alkaliphilus ACht1]
MSNRMVERAADNIRALTVAMVEKASSGHPGGAMGGADFMSILFSEYLRFDPDNPHWEFRDRFFLDPGHMSPMLYSTLYLTGHFEKEDLESFRQWGSNTPGHPELDVAHGIENSSGPLGMGHAMALGSAVAERFLRARFGEWMGHTVYTYVSDGAIQEEISQGVGRIAGHLGMSNLVMFFDSNDIQLSHTTDKTYSEDTQAKYESWGWDVFVIDGHDYSAIRGALDSAQKSTKPVLIIGKTVMGKKAVDAAGNSFEKQVSSHGQPLSKAGADINKTLQNLGADPADPFAIFPEVQTYFESVLENKRRSVKDFSLRQKEWEEANPVLAQRLTRYLAGEKIEIDFSTISVSPNSATRNTSGEILAHLAGTINNMIVSSADLSNSDKTSGFLDNCGGEFTRDDFSGAFLQAGVSELTMAAIMNGLALHGGMIPVCATFFVFSDYMKPAIRLAALMGLPVRYIFTHDSFRVGEDGPTHQPVEQEAQIRLLEKMKNLEEERSITVFRPADSAETLAAWSYAYYNDAHPTILILTRQNVADLPKQKERLTEGFQLSHGAYTVYPEKTTSLDVVLLANGSEVYLLVEVARALEEKGVGVRVVSAPCEGLWDEQSTSYRDSVLPFGVPVFALTAGLKTVFDGMVGPLGMTMGRDGFGRSAPFSVLDEKFGYTCDQVVPHVEAYLQEYRELCNKIGQ